MASESPELPANIGFEDGSIGWALLQSDIWNHIIPASRKLSGGFRSASLPARVCSSVAEDYLGDSIGFIATTPCPTGEYDLCLSLRMPRDAPDATHQTATAPASAANAPDMVFHAPREGFFSAVFLMRFRPPHWTSALKT